ncbi:MAG: GTPase HflX [Betaproteobacteria bacterium]|nr:MAG: GTPase HflX [Betaproteobacteria bacterium]
MAERSSERNTAVLVGLDFGVGGYAEGIEELSQLAASAGIRARALVRGRRERPDPAYFAGSGKVEEIRRTLQEQGASLAIFNHDLSPAQERNLEKALGCPVVDRTRLILNIFAQRAKSHEGKLQVELAQLEHAATRLVRGWSHLERQRGGKGFLGGMGETQLEVDRRLIANRVKILKDKLGKLGRRREVQRRARERGRAFSVSLVGYTNAGKSTLFNTLTHAGALAEDRLFATLDTTTRRLYLPAAGNIAISDTVGFIRDLPHTLVAAFRATLEEAIHADLLLHVVDAANDAREAQILEVDKVLAEIGARAVPRLLVWNKIDRNGLQPGVDRNEYDRICRVRLSAKTGDGVDGLRRALIEATASRTSPASPPKPTDSKKLGQAATT